MRRHLIGIIALLLLIGAVVFWIWPPEGSAGLQLEAACWRVGALMSVLWVAYPQVHHMPVWLWAAIPVLIIILARWPRYFLVAIPVLIALAILKPRTTQRR